MEKNVGVKLAMNSRSTASAGTAGNANEHVERRAIRTNTGTSSARKSTMKPFIHSTAYSNPANPLRRSVITTPRLSPGNWLAWRAALPGAAIEQANPTARTMSAGTRSHAERRLRASAATTVAASATTATSPVT